MCRTKLNVAIVGYGNLGKATEEVVLTEGNINLLCIFSRRHNVISSHGTPVISAASIMQYKDKIDLLILCGGSQNDMLIDAPLYAEHFNIINTFDTHHKIESEFNKINEIATGSQHMAIMCCGWDPGLFSVLRTLMFSVSKTKPVALYGKGVSMGHTQAVKNIKGVINALSFTTYNKRAIYAINNNKPLPKHLHIRNVFVVANSNVDKIKDQIISMKHYFKGECVHIKFGTQKELNSIKTFAHKGKMISKISESEYNHEINFSIKTSSNPIFTAKILVCYIRNFNKLLKKYKCGAFTPLHFSALDICDLQVNDVLKELC